MPFSDYFGFLTLYKALLCPNPYPFQSVAMPKLCTLTLTDDRAAYKETRFPPKGTVVRNHFVFAPKCTVVHYIGCCNIKTHQFTKWLKKMRVPVTFNGLLTKKKTNWHFWTIIAPACRDAWLWCIRLVPSRMLAEFCTQAHRIKVTDI